MANNEYEAHRWTDKELITAPKLNRIEEQLEYLTDNVFSMEEGNVLTKPFYYKFQYEGTVNNWHETPLLYVYGNTDRWLTSIISHNDDNRIWFREYSNSEKYENYSLPAPDQGLADNQFYNILTDKPSMRTTYINSLLQIDPINSTGSDTTQNWVTNKTGIAWYNTTGQLNDQPSQWGFLLNINTTAGRQDVHQLWLTQSSGNIFHRGGNNNGWSGSWRRIVDVITLGSVESGSSATFNLSNGRWLIMTGHNSTVAHNGLWIVNMGSDGGRTVVNIGGGANITITTTSGKITVACTNNGAVAVYALQIA